MHNPAGLIQQFKDIVRIKIIVFIYKKRSFYQINGIFYQGLSEGYTGLGAPEFKGLMKN